MKTTGATSFVGSHEDAGLSDVFLQSRCGPWPGMGPSQRADPRLPQRPGSARPRTGRATPVKWGVLTRSRARRANPTYSAGGSPSPRSIARSALNRMMSTIVTMPTRR